MKKIPDIIVETSRRLRKDMTKSEKILWEMLKSKKLINKKFVRQIPIHVLTEDNGFDRYIIADFLCRENNLIIELDGSIHDKEEIYNLDIEKEKLLINLGYKILRFRNLDIINDLDNSLNIIKSHVK